MPASTARTLFVRALQRSRAPGWLTVAAVCWACGGNEAPLPQKAPPTYGIPRQRPTNTATTPLGQSQDLGGLGPNRGYEADRQSPRFDPPPVAPVQQGAPPEEKKARDYSAELAGLLSKSAPGCLASSKPSTSSVTIQVTAQVMASGMVSRAEAQGAGLAPSVLSCIKSAASALQLMSPVADAPRSVQTQLTLQTQSTQKSAQPTAAVKEDNDEDERDGNPRDSRIHRVDDDPAEVQQKVDEPTREAPEPPDPKDEPPADNHAD